MNLTITIHGSWADHVPALAEILSRVAALEHLAPPRPPPQPGDDDDTSELSSGIDTPESTPPRPSTPDISRRSESASALHPYDPTPRTGDELYRWAVAKQCLPVVAALGKARGYNRTITTWDATQVADVFHEVLAGKTAGA